MEKILIIIYIIVRDNKISTLFIYGETSSINHGILNPKDNIPIPVGAIEMPIDLSERNLYWNIGEHLGHDGMREGKKTEIAEKEVKIADNIKFLGFLMDDRLSLENHVSSFKIMCLWLWEC